MGRSNVPDTVEQEVRMHVRRLHSHPSIVIWATDNEVKQAINDGWYKKPRDRILMDNFKKLFVDSVKEAVQKEEGPKRMDLVLAREGTNSHEPRRCLISSPSNGRLTEELEGLDLHPQDPHYGDVHFYTYSGNLWSERSYPITRFTSEFGMQSLPSPLAWNRSLRTDSIQGADWDINGPLVAHRQHHSLGLGLFQLAVEHLGEPVKVSDPVMQYSRWAYLTQVNQLMSYRTHINLLMRHQCQLVSAGGLVEPAVERTSMGAIYWQLNDVWSAPTWSTLDAAGQWKMAHYGAVRECFANFPTGRLVAQFLSGMLQVDWIPPTLPESMITRPDTLGIRCMTIERFQTTNQWDQNIAWESQNISCPVPIMYTSINDVVNRCRMTNVNRNLAFIHFFMIRGGKVVPTGGTISPFNLPAKIPFWPVQSGYNGIKIEDVKPIDTVPNSLQWPMPWKPSDSFQLQVRSSSPELFVWLELHPSLDVQYWFDENAFHLLDSTSRTVYLFVLTDHPVNVSQIKSALTFHSLSTMRQPKAISDSGLL
ncbi:unnamed protein product [Echinostoma caproni]|uniref:Beta-mannosidase n=1 Tax=Echinostoma caproni TaxID=27848 RepID=A0A183A9L5_9TREM|nr:unnamed protein product [Echinostoma caproni]